LRLPDDTTPRRIARSPEPQNFPRGDAPEILLGRMRATRTGCAGPAAVARDQGIERKEGEMTSMRERIARRLIDIDPCISGYHPLHLELKYPIIDAVLDELMQPSDEMVDTIVGGMLKPLNVVTREMAFNSWQAAIRAAKEGN
jgi:hypothetical protein